MRHFVYTLKSTQLNTQFLFYIQSSRKTKKIASQRLYSCVFLGCCDVIQLKGLGNIIFLVEKIETFSVNNAHIQFSEYGIKTIQKAQKKHTEGKCYFKIRLLAFVPSCCNVKLSTSKNLLASVNLETLQCISFILLFLSNQTLFCNIPLLSFIIII